MLRVPSLASLPHQRLDRAARRVGSMVASLADLPGDRLDRLIWRVVLLVAVVVVAFVAIYASDRWRPSSPPIIDQRLAALEGAVRTDPNDIASRGELGDVYFAAGRYDEAIAQYDAILETGKADTLAHFSRGRAYLAAGRLDAAAEDYQAVVDALVSSEMANVDANLEAAYYSLGSIALQQDRPADAVARLGQALAIDRADADALNLLGQAYVRTGESDKAIAALRRATDFVPIGWTEPYQALAAAYADAGEPELAEWAAALAVMQSGDLAAAEARLRPLVEGSAAVDALVGLGLIAETRGDTGLAAERYAKALAVDPEDVAAQLGAGRVRPVSSAPADELPGLPAPAVGGTDG